jgi:hypothetical protein
MSEEYVEKNRTERERLEGLTANRAATEFARDMDHEWTVATKLLHLAFWDLYAAGLLRKWKRSGLTDSAYDTDALNEAVRVLSRAIRPEAAVALARAAAVEVDGEAADVAPELREAIERAGRSRSLERSLHRRAHLDQIEVALRK